MAVKDVHDIPTNICNINQAKQDLQIHPIRVTESDYYYIIEEIERREKIKYEININVEDC